MSHPSRIRPYVPKKLPVEISIDRELKNALLKTHEALERYNTTLKKISLPQDPVRFFALQEAVVSSDLCAAKNSFNSLNKNTHKNPTIGAFLKAFEDARKSVKRRPFSKALLCKIHAEIKHPTATPNSKLGNYRTAQNWIGPQGCSQKDAYYLPPTPRRVGAAMKQWICYFNQPTDEPLLQLSQLVAQLLIIHPFMDGNGRIARLLIPLFLYRENLIAEPTLFFSQYIRKHRLAYLRSLYEITAEGNWRTWTLFFLKGLRVAALRRPLI